MKKCLSVLAALAIVGSMQACDYGAAFVAPQVQYRSYQVAQPFQSYSTFSAYSAPVQFQRQVVVQKQRFVRQRSFRQQRVIVQQRGFRQRSFRQRNVIVNPAPQVIVEQRRGLFGFGGRQRVIIR